MSAFHYDSISEWAAAQLKSQRAMLEKAVRNKDYIGAALFERDVFWIGQFVAELERQSTGGSR